MIDKRFGKRAISLLLALVMLLGMTPVTATAGEDGGGNPYKGKVISILGDSISTFSGYISSGNSAFYPKHDVQNVADTWWMQLISELGATLGVNESWSGSYVLNTIDGNSGSKGEDVAMASLTRIQRLDDNGTPGVIVFFGGTNDIAFGSPLGSFDPDLAPEEAELSATKWDTYAAAYTAAILRMKYYYPDAHIIAVLPTINNYYYDNDTLEQYNSVMRAICNHYGVSYVDLAAEGFTKAMLGDATHPNAGGMDFITSVVKEKLFSLHTHSYTSAITAPTCTEQGYTTYTCECGDSYVGDYVEATGHTYTNGVCTGCGEVEREALSTDITVLPGQLVGDTGEIVDSEIYGYIVNYPLKKGHVLSISDDNYVFSVRKYADGNYSTMLKEATVGSFTATEDMVVGCLIRKPDKSTVTEEELASVTLCDTLYAMSDVPGSVHRFTVEAETIEGGTSTTRAAIFLPESYSADGEATRLIIMTNGLHAYLTDSVWNSNTDDDVGVMRHYMENGYAVVVVNNTANRVNGAPDWGNPQLVDSYWKAYEYVQEHFNVEKLFSIHSRSMGTFAAMRMMRERPELVKCALMCGAVLSLKSRFSTGPAHIANRYGFDDQTGATWEADKVVGYDPYTDVNGIEYDLPPTFWMLATTDATTAHLSTIEKIKNHGNDVTQTIYTDTDHSGVCRLNIEACRVDSLAFLEKYQDAETEHRFCAWETFAEANCTEAGEMRRYCADCEHYETIEIPALSGHVFDEGETVCVTCGVRFDVVHTDITLTPGQFNNTTGERLADERYGCVIGYELKAGHTLSISDTDYVFAVRVLEDGSYATMVREATAENFTADKDMTVAIRIRKPDKSALSEEELATVVLYDTCYVEHSHTYTNGVCTGCGKELKPYQRLTYFTVDVEAENGKTYTDNAVLYLPESYSVDGEAVKLIIYCKQGSSTITSSSNPIEAVGFYNYLLSLGYAILGVDGVPDARRDELGLDETRVVGNPLAVRGTEKAYDYVIENYNIADDGCFISGYSQGGHYAQNVIDLTDIPILAAAEQSPVCSMRYHQWDLNASQTVGGVKFTKAARLNVARIYGFPTVTSNAELLNLAYDSDLVAAYDPWVRNSENAYTGFVQKGNLWRLPDGVSVDDITMTHTVKCPVKIWCAEDDTAISADVMKVFVKAIRNAGGTAEISVAESGGHGFFQKQTAVGTFTENGKKYNTLPIAVEIAEWFAGFGGYGHTHSYTSAVTAPTCTEQGYTTYTCTTCGDSYVDDYVEATGHTEVIDPKILPTSEKTGLTEGSHCDECGEVLTAQVTVPAKGYDWMLEDGEFKLLLIGNSYSEDASSCGQKMTESQLLNILQAMLGEDVKVTVGLAYSGGKGLNWHATQADQGKASHSLRVIESDGTWTSKGTKVLSDALEWTDWDVVSLQHYNINTSTGEESVPYPDTTDEKFYKMESAAEYLLDYVNDHAPQANAYFYTHWLQTSSTTLNAALTKYKNMAAYMPVVLDYVGTGSGKTFADLIPVGLSIQNARTTYLALLAYNTTAYADKNLNLYTDAQIGLQRDGGHVSFNIGRYIAGLTFAETIIPEELRADGYELPDIRITESVGKLPAEYTEIAQKAVFAAVSSWKNGKLDEVTAIEGYAEDPTVEAAETIKSLSLQLHGDEAELAELITAEVLAALPADFAVDAVKLPESTDEVFKAEVTIRFGYTSVTAPVECSLETHTYTNGICTVCGAEHPNLANYEGKVISILSASTSTFAGYIPVADGFNLEHRARYPQSNLLSDVDETWWMQLINGLDAKLGINESWAGSQVLNTLDTNSGDLGPDAAMASLTRIQNLGANGTPDVIFFFGGGNDMGRGVTLGSFDPDTAPSEVDLTSTKWDSFADAYVAAIMRLQHYYPDAEIVVMTTYEMPSYVTGAKLEKYGTVIEAVCRHYGVDYVDLRSSGVTYDMLPDNIHPNAEGMDCITEAVMDYIFHNCEVEAGENTVYSVTHELTNAKSSKSYYKGVSHGKSFVTAVTGEELTVVVTMGGVDITADCYADGIVSIENVTGDIVIKAKAAFSADGHLQPLPEKMCAGTNLWAALEPENIYYTAEGWGNTSAGTTWSITFPVQPGDRISATSLGAYPENGSSANGVRVTWFDENGVLETVSRDKVYVEFAEYGYITAPEGAVALNLPMTNNQEHYGVYVLNASHDYTHAVCTLCGHDELSAVEENGGLTVSSETLESGTVLYLACYGEGGRMASVQSQVWDGADKNFAIPEGSTWKLMFFGKDTNVLRNPVSSK